MAEIDPNDIEVRWSDERAEQNRVAIHAAIAARKKRVARAAVVVPLAAAFALAFVFWPRTDTEDPGRTQPAVDDTLRFQDGSWARARENTDAQIALDTPTRSQLELARGEVEVDVVPNPQRVFEVVAGDVRVRVLGTRFFVEQRETQVHVRVERGRVRVSWPTGDDELGAGESGLFPPAAPPASEGSDDSSANVDDAPEVTDAPPAPRAPTGAWRTRAARNDFSGAYRALREDGFDTVRNTAEDLMLAADVARLSGHPAQALAPLRSLLARHASDARAPLAAFTLGRVLLEDLHRPAQAARAFRRAQSLGPSGPLFGDAMMREAEAQSAAGQHEAGRATAQRYLERFPSGRHSARARSLVQQ